MKNPLIKRIKRELIQELGKNIAIFLFLAGTIGFISGFLVADKSMQAAYDESFEKYAIEQGDFEVSEELSGELEEKINDLGIRLYQNYYVEKETDEEKTVRIFWNRQEVNRVCVLKGKLPSAKKEIAIDRLFAENNHYKVGKTMVVDGDTYQIVGLVALSDYSALYKDNNEFMFDATDFGVAVVTREQFNHYDGGKIFYSYAWRFEDENLTEAAVEEKNEALKETLLENGAALVNFIPEKDNQAIHFAGNDMGSDESMVKVLLWLLMIILAFIFAVTGLSTVERESAVIGTLRASGYTRGEILRHYMAMPLLVTLIASLVGNILGYTYFKNLMAALYYNSYSLPTYTTLWNLEAFLQTTVVPFVIMLVVNLLVLSTKLRLSPLQFLRHDLRKSKRTKAVRLPKLPFMTRFKLRILLQNRASYLVLFVGILFAALLSLFGLMMLPLLDHNEEIILDNMKGEYQYVLKMPVETADKEAQKCNIGSLLVDKKGCREDEVTVFGIEPDSRYFEDINLPQKAGQAVVSEAILEKLQLKKGDDIQLKSEFTGKTYVFEITGVYHYPQGLAIFLGSDLYRELFSLPEGYFNAYLSENKLTDIDEKMILTKINRADMIKVTTQLKDSFGGMMPILAVFSVGMSMLMIYLLSKIVIEKNANAISMVKILGYSNREISRLYVYATGIVAIGSALVSLPIANYAMRFLYFSFMKEFAGWVSYYVKPVVFAEVLCITVVSYVAVAALLFEKIRKVKMSDALKNVD